jgi:hypothetical protein
MAVFLTVGFAFQCCADGCGGGQQGGVDHVACRSWATVARIHQLNGSTRCGQSDDGQLEQPSSRMHLRLLQTHAIAFQRAEHLFYTPYKIADNLTGFDESPRLGLQALCALVRWLGSRDERGVVLSGLGDTAGRTAARPRAHTRPDGNAPDPHSVDRTADHRGDSR